MDEYAEAILTVAALTFWVWFPLLLSLLCLIILGRLVYRRSVKGSRETEEIKAKVAVEKNTYADIGRGKTLFTEDDRLFLEKNLEEICSRVGKKKKYYIEGFSSRKSIKINWASAVGGVLWLGYRGMFKELFITFSLLGIFDYITYNLGLEISTGIPTGAIFGMLGNYLYFKSLQRRVENNREEVNRLWGVLLAFSLLVFYITCRL